VTDYDLPDDEFLDLPDSAGNPSRLSILRHERLMEELAAERAGTKLPIHLREDSRRKAEDARHHADFERLIAEIQERADLLLQEIDEYQERLERQRQEIERHALHLHDGRIAYLDGDDYRDEYGSVLTGRDRDEAERLNQDHPHASTWQEHETNARDIAKAEDLRQRAETARAGETTDSLDDLSDYEKQLHQEIASKAKEDTHDYDTDYNALSSAPAFNGAASPDAVAAPDEKKTETETAQFTISKKAPQPAGQGALKI